MPYLSALEVCSRQGAIWIHILPLLLLVSLDTAYWPLTFDELGRWCGVVQVWPRLIDWRCCAGRDTLRCLALATIDDPVDLKAMNLEDSTQFVKYEVRAWKFVRLQNSDTKPVKIHIQRLQISAFKSKFVWLQNSNMSKQCWSKCAFVKCKF